MLAKGSAFYLSTPQQPTLVVPRDAIDDYKNLPKAVMSFGGEIQDRFQGAYTYLGNTPLASIVSIKSNMTHEMGMLRYPMLPASVPTINVGLIQPILWTISTKKSSQRWTPKWLSVPVYPPVRSRPLDIYSHILDWTPVRFKACAARIIAKVSGRVFVGPVLSRNEDYLASTIGYTADVFVSASKVRLSRGVEVVRSPAEESPHQVTPIPKLGATHCQMVDTGGESSHGTSA